ncbi:MAG: glycosyltransferase [Spirochaetia bacterium]|nr:glycosyltransferase [Spirochaetota bacterium]MDW8113268.1 glycosyltransferase [Spirochaetia bacterium]
MNTNGKIRVLFIWHGAVEKNYRQLFYEMSKHGLEMIVITAKRWFETSKWQTFETIELDKHYKIYPLRTIFTNHVRAFFYLNFIKIAWIILKHKPDVVYLKQEPYSTAGFVILLLTKILNPKSKILIESDENIFKNHPIPFKFFEKLNLRLSDALVVIPTDAIEMYRSKGFGKEIYKTYYFIPEFRTDVEPLDVRSNAKLKVGFAGRISKPKGVDIIILALSELKKRNINDIELFIVGYPEDNEYYQYIIKLAEEKDIKMTHLGSFGLDKMFAFYKTIDVLVLPSRTVPWWKEQFGRVLVEAMACGTPCVGSSSGEIPRVINNPNLIFQEDNFKELADILEKFYNKEYSKDKLLESLIQYSKNFTIEAVAKNKAEIVRKVYEQNKQYL